MASTSPDHNGHSPPLNTDSASSLPYLHSEIDRLQLSILLLRDEVAALKSESRSYQSELTSMQNRIGTLEAQIRSDKPILHIGKEVRLRFLERYRQRMGHAVGPGGYERIRAGDKAANRGRPAVDAILCLTGEMRYLEAYKDLYGLQPEEIKGKWNVPEMLAVTGFRASLQSEGKMTEELEGLFGQLIEVTRMYGTAAELEEAFKTNKVLQQLHDGIQHFYDKVIAENRR